MGEPPSHSSEPLKALGLELKSLWRVLRCGRQVYASSGGLSGRRVLPSSTFSPPYVTPLFHSLKETPTQGPSMHLFTQYILLEVLLCAVEDQF